MKEGSSTSTVPLQPLHGALGLGFRALGRGRRARGERSLWRVEGGRRAWRLTCGGPTARRGHAAGAPRTPHEGAPPMRPTRPGACRMRRRRRQTPSPGASPRATCWTRRGPGHRAGNRRRRRAGNRRRAAVGQACRRRRPCSRRIRRRRRVRATWCGWRPAAARLQCTRRGNQATSRRERARVRWEAAALARGAKRSTHVWHGCGTKLGWRVQCAGW